MSISSFAIDSAVSCVPLYLAESSSVWRASSSALNDDATCLGGAALDNELAAVSGADTEEEKPFGYSSTVRHLTRRVFSKSPSILVLLFRDKSQFYLHILQL